MNETQKEASDKIKETEAEHRHSVSRTDIKGVTQCAEHSWRKLTDTEIACNKCPTVRIVPSADNFIK